MVDIAELLGWKETEGMSDDARRKLWLMREAAAEITRLRAEKEKLREALKPFAAEADDYDPVGLLEDDDLPIVEPRIKVVHLRRARTAIQETEDGR